MVEQDKWLIKCKSCIFCYQDMETSDYHCRCTNGCHYVEHKPKDKHIKDSTELSGGHLW